MKVQVNRPITIDDTTYGKGQHEMPLKHTNNNWFFDALVADGDVVVLRDDEDETKPSARRHK